MATKVTSVTEITDGIKERSAELSRAMIMVMDGKSADGKTLMKNTISTTRHHIKRDQRVLALIADLTKVIADLKIEKVTLSDTALEGLNQMCYPDKGGSKVSVKEGDSILALMQEYGEVKDLKAKLDKAAENAGLVLNFKTGKVEKK